MPSWRSSFFQGRAAKNQQSISSVKGDFFDVSHIYSMHFLVGCLSRSLPYDYPRLCKTKTVDSHGSVSQKSIIFHRHLSRVDMDSNTQKTSSRHVGFH